METTSSFGDWLRRQRRALDLTQQALAERVGCSLAAIKKIEQDERRPSLQIAERMVDALGVLANQFRAGASISQKPPTDEVERFLSILWFDSRGKVNALGCYANVATSRTCIRWFESGFKLEISTGP